MRFQSVPQLFLLALGVIVSLAMGVSNVASNDFASRNARLVSTTNDMVAMDCQDSGGGLHCEANTACAAICAGPVMALPLAVASLEQACSALYFATLLAKSLVGSSPPPELSPPRTTYIA